MKTNIDCEENNKVLNFPINFNSNKENQILNVSDEQPITTKDSCESCKNSNIALVSNNHNINFNLKFLTKYKNVYVPKIFLINYNDTSEYPSKGIINNSQNLNPNGFNIFSSLFPFSFSAYQNNREYKDYLNYGYNFDQWKSYANDIRNKFDELNDLVEKGKIKLPRPDNELEYLMSLPSDFGGLGNLFNEHEYENVKFYDSKIQENKNKNFMKEVKIEHKMIWFNLNPNPESITTNIKLNPFQMNLLSQQYLCSLNNNKNKENNININSLDERKNDDNTKNEDKNLNNEEVNENKLSNSEDKEDNQDEYRDERRIKNRRSSKNGSSSRNISRSRSGSMRRKGRRSNYRDYEYEERPYKYKYRNHYSSKYEFKNYYKDNKKYFNKYEKRNYNYKNY